MPPTPSNPTALTTMTSTLHTTLALIDQFTTSLQVADPSPTPTSPSTTPSPLPLLSASASLLKSNATKLSLLAITPSFTLSAITIVLKVLNDSVLPSLVTGALLVDEDAYTMCFATEARSLLKASLRELGALLGLVLARSKGGETLSEKEKCSVTEAIGRVWESCDALLELANGGVGTFVVKRAEMWLGLMKDAVEEIKEWDPEEEDDDDIFGDDASSVEENEENGKHGEKDIADLEEQNKVKAEMKKEALRVLERVPQSLHVVVKQRLKKGLPEAPWSEDVQSRIDHFITQIRSVSQMLDATAEALYLGDRPLCRRRTSDVWQRTVELVELAQTLWCPERSPDSRGETEEDKYLERALKWIKQVEPT